MKKCLTIALILMALLALLTVQASAAEKVAGGFCGNYGDNLTWTLNSDGVLSIEGKYAMQNYGSGDAPWYDYYESIEKVVISDGVESIGRNAFYFCVKLTEVELPDSVTAIYVQKLGNGS